MNILMIGSHPDDCDFRCSGLAAKYVRAGHRVRFLSVSDGSAGHQTMGRAELAARRWQETQDAAKVIGIEYDVWDIPDGQIVADLPTRARMVRYIREFQPDIVFCCRNNDYHADHRATGLLVQDASYLLIVPNYCPDAPALRKMPVIMHFYDPFRNPPFLADVVIAIDDVMDLKFRMLDKHVSQVYEWLPFTCGTADRVPHDPAERLAWIYGTPLTTESTDEEVRASHGYSRDSAWATILYRDKLIERYGEEKGRKVRFAEAFAISEYGAQPNAGQMKELFPF